MRNERGASILNGLVLLIAGIVDATGFALMLMPSRVIDGGIAGVSLLLSHATGLSASIFLVCLNLPFFLIGMRKLGVMFMVHSFVAIGMYSLMTYIYTDIAGLDTVVYEMLGTDMFLCAIFGGLLSGMGSGITIKCGGAIDGIDVMAVMFAKKVGITEGQFIMIFNVTMYLIGSIVLADLRIGLYSIVSYAIGQQAVDFIVNGFDKCKAVNIITTKGEELSELISKKMGRGITILNAKGYYSNESKTMMYCVVNRFEVVGLKKLIKSIDPQAFVTINEITDIMGTKIKVDSIFTKKKPSTEPSEPPVVSSDNVDMPVLGAGDSIDVTALDVSSKPSDRDNTNT